MAGQGRSGKVYGNTACAGSGIPAGLFEWASWRELPSAVVACCCQIQQQQRQLGLPMLKSSHKPPALMRCDAWMKPHGSAAAGGNLGRERGRTALRPRAVPGLAGGLLRSPQLPHPRLAALDGLLMSAAVCCCPLQHYLANDQKLKKFVPLIKDSLVYPVIFDAERTLLSLPPIIRRSRHRGQQQQQQDEAGLTGSSTCSNKPGWRRQRYERLVLLLVLLVLLDLRGVGGGQFPWWLRGGCAS